MLRRHKSQVNVAQMLHHPLNIEDDVHFAEMCDTVVHEASKDIDVIVKLPNARYRLKQKKMTLELQERGTPSLPKVRTQKLGTIPVTPAF